MTETREVSSWPLHEKDLAEGVLECAQTGKMDEFYYEMRRASSQNEFSYLEHFLLNENTRSI